MEILPMVTAPARGEILFLHLATPFDGVSAILFVEKRNVQIAIYFVSRVLQGIERDYVESERLILALVHATRRLRRYFKDHPIRVLTDKPIEWAFLNPNRSRKMAKWAMELDEYDIEYGMDNFVEGQTHIPTELGKSIMSSNKGTFEAKRKEKIHLGDLKMRITSPNPKEDKCLLEPNFEYEVEQQASTE
ncbi:hypothetical protein CTI12_AA462440 [Artemisia annua]|uniref:Reverse transcriptase RNase H-like domain-containing protein n=1 Tax=Artemisia annua TaxID=35608 RepID=A0A2U1LRN2_ARTAN|nr:hypothetical protein CTI12_AA462440 [Artemisia annua]